MKVAIVKVSQLADCKCWSALRFTDSFENCNKCMAKPRFGRCDLPEAQTGRKRILDKKIHDIRSELENLVYQHKILD